GCANKRHAASWRTLAGLLASHSIDAKLFSIRLKAKMPKHRLAPLRIADHLPSGGVENRRLSPSSLSNVDHNFRIVIFLKLPGSKRHCHLPRVRLAAFGLDDHVNNVPAVGIDRKVLNLTQNFAFA